MHNTVCSSPSDLVAELSNILRDSSASMKVDSDLATDQQKAAWWTKRLALDQRMHALLQHVAHDWLGPWRCLLVQPPDGVAQAAALRAEAASFVTEHFEFVFGEYGLLGVWGQLLAKQWISCVIRASVVLL